MEIFPVKPHSVFIFELILTPCLWLVNHTGYRIRIYPLGTLLKLLKTGLPPFTERSIFRIIFFYLSRTYFHRKGHFKCTQQLCEHRQHMQEFPQSQPLQPQLDHFLQKKYSWAHRTWWAQMISRVFQSYFLMEISITQCALIFGLAPILLYHLSSQNESPFEIHVCHNQLKIFDQFSRYQ